jgi:NADP-dependent 3-hydroxy acid dehydrogenase YdfG
MIGRLVNKVAVVTGASSGIGRAVALALARDGAELALLGRRVDVLKSLAEECGGLGTKARQYEIDFLADARFADLAAEIRRNQKRVDILVHSAGIFAASPIAESSLADFDLMFRCNVRAPFALTQLLLPALRESRGQIVFINSTAGLISAAGISQYAATKHALKAIADSLREEVNEQGIRVVSIFPGRTATPMQARVHELEGKDYRPDELIQPDQVAQAVLGALVMGPEAEVTEIRLRPMLKPGSGSAGKERPKS